MNKHPSPDQAALERLNDRIILDPNGCWVWQGGLNRNGYGQTGVKGQNWMVHRLVYTLIKGDIPDGLQLDHLCRVRACCNPEHLEPVTGLVNIRRSPIHHGSKVRCKQGHPFTAENTGINRHKGQTRRFCRTCQREWNRVCAAKRRAKTQEDVA